MSFREDKLIECIPNVSEGRDITIINAIADAIKSVDGVYLLNVDSGESANRTVYTFVGTPKAVVEAGYRLFEKAHELIDMRNQSGEHPRMGAVDVFPMVPLKNMTIEEVDRFAVQLAEKVGRDFNVPIYLYASSARREERENLALIRRGEYEGMSEKMKDPQWKPDYGPAEFNPQTGTTALGARDFLIAFNVNLNTKDEEVAWEIARDVREIGRVVTDAGGRKKRIPGKCVGLKAIGWYIEEFACAQVSMNITDLSETGVYEAFEACKESAAERGYEVTGAELVGLVPKSEMIYAGRKFLKLDLQEIEHSERELIEIAVETMNLSSVKPFDIDERIIEYRLAAVKSEKR